MVFYRVRTERVATPASAMPWWWPGLSRPHLPEHTVTAAKMRVCGRFTVHSGAARARAAEQYDLEAFYWADQLGFGPSDVSFEEHGSFYDHVQPPSIR